MTQAKTAPAGRASRLERLVGRVLAWLSDYFDERHTKPEDIPDMGKQYRAAKEQLGIK